MSLSYPLSLPSIVSFATLSIFADTAAARNENEYTLKQQIFPYDGERWRLKASFPKMEIATAKDIIGFLLSLYGYTGTFYAGDPLFASPEGVAIGTPLVKGASQAGHSLVTDGWAISTTNILKRGDQIQIGNYLYSVVKDVNSNGSGEATLDLWPILRAPADNAPVIVSSPKSLFRLDSPVVSWSTGADRVYDLSFEAVEVMP